MRRSILTISVFVFVAAMGAAQAPLRIGWFDWRDSRSGTTGLGTQIAAQSGVISKPFSISAPNSFKPEHYDVVIFGSFAELHEDWDRFVGARKADIEAFVRRGGTLILMCRYRKSDDRGRASLLPSVFEVRRGKKDIKDDEWYVCYKTEPMWRGFGKDKKNGWNRLPKTKVGPNELDCGLDAFDSWSKNLVRSSDLSMNVSPRFHKAYSLTGRLDAGRVLLFQLVLDKIDRTTRPLALKQCREFFATLTAYLKTRPRIALPEVVKTVPNDPPIKDTPVINRPPARYRLEGRVFLDTNGNGRLDTGEPGVADLTIREGTRTVSTDKKGNYSLEVSNETPGQLVLDLVAESAASSLWFVNLNAGDASKSTLRRDLPLKPRPKNESPLVLVASLPREITPATAALMEIGLAQALTEHRITLAVFLSPHGDSRTVKTISNRLRSVTSSAGVGFRLLAPLPAEGAAQISRLHGPDRYLLAEGPLRLAFAAGRNSVSWLAARRGDPQALILISGTDMGFAERSRLEKNSALVVVPMISRGEEPAETGPLTAPIFMEGELRDQAAHYALISWSEGAPARRFLPLPEAGTPGLPVHPLGRGDLDALLEEAGK